VSVIVVEKTEERAKVARRDAREECHFVCERWQSNDFDVRGEFFEKRLFAY
jgi:hypothetical protein